MRILTVVRNLGPGGTQRSAQTHAECYHDAGVDSAVFAYESGGPRLEPLLARGIPVFQAETDGPDAALQKAIAWGPDAVHVHRPGAADPQTDAILASLRAAGVRAVVETNHFSRADRGQTRGLIDVHVQLSKWCLWQWRRRCQGLTPAPVGIALPHIIRADQFGAIDQDARNQWRAEHGVPADAIVLGRIGQPNRPSWSRVLFRAFAEVAARDERVWLVTVGLPRELHPVRDELPEPLRRRVVGIDFLHGDAALRRCYGSLDVFAHASRCGETFGMVICEAGLARVPTVTLSTPARANSQVEVVGHGRGGLVAGDARHFARALASLVDQPSERAALGEGAARWIREHCDPKAITDRMLAVFGAVMQGGSRDDLAARLHAIPGVVDQARTEELVAMLSKIPGASPIRDRFLMAASTMSLARRVKQRVVATLRRRQAR
jgi:hypothetical protein